MFKKPFVFFVVGMSVVMFFGTGCERIRVQSHGKHISKEELARLKVGEHTKGDVLALVGSPTTISPFDDDTWYYSGHQESKVAFLDPALDKHQTIVVTFTKEGVLQGVNTRGKEAVVTINPSDAVTPSAGQNSSVLNKLFQHQRIFSSREKHEENKGK